MITGTHILLFSTDADADRSFLRNVLGFASVDAGHGWLIFRMPPAEAAVHPAEQQAAMPHVDGNLLGASVYLMCDDVRAMVRQLETKKIKCAPIREERWGLRTAVTLPSGGELGLYQPLHPTALDLK